MGISQVGVNPKEVNCAPGLPVAGGAMEEKRQVPTQNVAGGCWLFQDSRGSSQTILGM